MLFSIGVVVFAATIVAAMVVGRQAFGRIYEAQVADARGFVLHGDEAAAVIEESPSFVSNRPDLTK